MLDKIIIKKYKFMSEYDGKISEIIWNLLQVEKSCIVCYTIHAQINKLGEFHCSDYDKTDTAIRNDHPQLFTARRTSNDTGSAEGRKASSVADCIHAVACQGE